LRYFFRLGTPKVFPFLSHSRFSWRVGGVCFFLGCGFDLPFATPGVESPSLVWKFLFPLFFCRPCSTVFFLRAIPFFFLRCRILCPWFAAGFCHRGGVIAFSFSWFFAFFFSLRDEKVRAGWGARSQSLAHLHAPFNLFTRHRPRQVLFAPIGAFKPCLSDYLLSAPPPSGHAFPGSPPLFYSSPGGGGLKVFFRSRLFYWGNPSRGFFGQF